MFEILTWSNAILSCCVGWLIYYLITKDINYFKKRNVEYIKPVPLLGIVYDMLTKKIPMTLAIQEGYNRFSDAKFFGVFEFVKPLYVVKDLEILKQMTIKNFDHFLNHRFALEKSNDKLFGQSLFFLKDQKWRDVRNTLSPAFTGSKMRLMFKLMADCSNNFMSKLETKADHKPMEVDMKSLSTMYANDIIAKLVYGTSVDSLEDPQNEFLKIVTSATNFPLIAQMKLIMFSSFPQLEKKFNLKIFEEKVVQFFTQFISNNMEFRRKNNIVLDDMLNLMMQAQKTGSISLEDDKRYESAGFATVKEFKEEPSSGNSKTSRKNWELDDIVANCFLFTFASIEPVSIAINYLVYELAMNPEVQEKLIHEIDDLNEVLEGNHPTYENIQKMEYLDMVISEVLRKWPPAATQDRMCTKQFTMENTDGTTVVLEPGNGIFIPIFAIMRDPKNYSEPEKFDPERFSMENRKNIPEIAYLPFGVGPRNCIGSRFALMELKVAFYFLLLKFRIEKSPKFQEHLDFKIDSFQMRTREGVNVNLVPRK